MFATAQGPKILEQGHAYISADVTVDILWALSLHQLSVYFTDPSFYSSENFVNGTLGVAFAIYAADELHHKAQLEGLCDSSFDIKTNTWASNVCFWFFDWFDLQLKTCL